MLGFGGDEVWRPSDEREGGACAPRDRHLHANKASSVGCVCADLVHDLAHRLGAREEDEVPPLGQQRCGLGGVGGMSIGSGVRPMMPIHATKRATPPPPCIYRAC